MIYLRYWLVYGEARKHQPSSLKPSPVLFPLCYFLPGVICSHIYFVSITLFQFSSVAQSCLTLCDPMNHSTPGLPVHQQSRSSHKPMSIELVMPSNHLILCRPPLLLPSIFPSIRVFSMSQLFTLGGQSIGVSASTSVPPMNTQD